MSIPDSVTTLAQARMDARAAKDFALADKYRDELLQAGFEVVDVTGGYELRPKKPYITLAYPRDIRPIDLETDVTVGLIVDGFTDDALETVKTIKANSDCAVAIISIGDAGALFEQMDKRTYLIAVTQVLHGEIAPTFFLKKLRVSM